MTSTISMFTRLTRNALILSGWLWARLALAEYPLARRASGYSASNNNNNNNNNNHIYIALKVVTSDALAAGHSKLVVCKCVRK